MSETVVINMFGGPSVGKSVMSWYTSYKMSILGYNVEYASEYAKEKVWEKNYSALDDQLYVFSKQRQKITRLVNNVDFVINDSPILLSIFYGIKTKIYKHFEQLVLNEFNSYNNYNFFIIRDDKFHKNKGRIHNLEQSKEIDKRIKNYLDTNNIKYSILHQDEFYNDSSDLNLFINNIDKNPIIKKIQNGLI